MINEDDSVEPVVGDPVLSICTRAVGSAVSTGLKLVGAKEKGDKLDSEGAGVVTVTVGALVFTEESSVDSTVGVTVYSISMIAGVNVFRLTWGLGVGSSVDKITSPQLISPVPQ